MVKLLLLLAVVLAGGCGQDGIQVYSIPKEQPAPMAQADLPADHPATPPQLKWKIPTRWKEVPAGDFRVASFKVTGTDGKQADVSVIPLPGTAGGDLSNVNRWRGQVGQEPVSAEELQKLMQAVEVAGQPAELYEQSGESSRILAVIQHRNGTAWFFKMTGDSQLVAREKPAFVAFLKSVQFASAEMPAGHPDISAMPPGMPAGTPSSAGKPQWTPAADWKEVPGGQFLVAKFTIANGQAAVNVSSSPGDGGGLAANVNRWRKQLGLGELSSDELAKSVKTIGPVTFVEMNGTDARSGEPAAVIGAISLQPGQAWFYKLMGDAKIVAAQKDAFIKFVQEVKY